MRITLIVLVAVLVGMGAGVGTAHLRLRSSEWNGDPIGTGDDAAVRAAADGGSGKAELSELEFDFGTMDESAKGRHDFMVTNVGEGVLEVTAGETSCGCTMSEIEKSELAPRESTKVTITWNAEGRSGPFRQTASVFTSDPDHSRVTFTVSGRIVQAVRVVPRELVFSQVAVGDSAEGTIRLFCNLPQPLEIQGLEFSEAEEAPYFDAQIEPLSGMQLASETGAQSGAQLLVTLKPGLPQGPFRQKILLKTNLEEASELVIPVRGTLVGDISIVGVGSGWEAEQSLLALGTVDSTDGVRRQLLLITRGEDRDNVVFEPVRVFPSWLEVNVGKTVQVGDGTVNQTPVWISVPKGAPSAVHLGSEQGELGEVRLKTNHPRTPELRIRLRFAVEGA